MRKSLPILVTAILLACIGLNTAKAQIYKPMQIPNHEYNPQQYISLKGTPVVDGKMDDKVWDKVEWSDLFQDIEGDAKPKPLQETRVKMLWDDSTLYVGARLYEKHIWATLRQRDTVIFVDNDFEVFIDPDGDNSFYYEYEINAYGTEWDLLLVHPYRSGDFFSPYSNGWDIQKLQSATYIDGTINDPSDEDNYWEVELAFPFEALAELAQMDNPPSIGDYIKINFSRVEWATDIIDGKYVKKKQPEFNWVWSPQGVINMHYPEMWGLVHFYETAPADKPALPKTETIKWNLRKIWYAVQNFGNQHQKYPENLSELGALFPKTDDEYSFSYAKGLFGFEIAINSPEGNALFIIDEKGRVLPAKK